MTKNKDEYLGDAVYVHQEESGYHLVLSTNSHLPKDWDQVIYLDPGVQERLYAYLKRQFNETT